MLASVLSSAMVATSAALCVPAGLFAVECIAGCFPGRQGAVASPLQRPPLAILVPAHNEEAGIAATLASVTQQMSARDRLIVVAHNCTDETALIARAAGAEVVECNEPDRRGKGFALDAGMRHLAVAPLDVVVIIDADCQLGPQTLDRLWHQVQETGGPVQARYLMTAPEGRRTELAVAEFAFLVKNQVRPQGLSNLGLPCQLTGTGMAFPYLLLSQANLAHGNLVEDMMLGLDLAKAGHPPQFCAGALITSEFPNSVAGSEIQRQRWEGGHLSLIKSTLPSLLDPALYRFPARLMLVLDLLIPPLTLLAVILGAMVVVTFAISMAGGTALALWISCINLGLLGAATALAWAVHARHVLPLRTLPGMMAYAFKKLKLYPAALLGTGGTAWVRSDRSGPSKKPDAVQAGD